MVVDRVDGEGVWWWTGCVVVDRVHGEGAW